MQEQGRYDDDYYRSSLHRVHWFHNNEAKHRHRWLAVLRMLEPDRGDVILELGCAAGEHAIRLAPLCAAVIGVDLSVAGIARAKAAAKAKQVANARFVVSDAASLGWLGDASIDKVASIDFFEHIDDSTLASVLREVRRVLRPGGRLAIFTPCRTHYVERMKANGILLRQIPGHIAVRDAARYRELLGEAGMRVNSLSYMPSTYPLAGMADRLLSGVPGLGSFFRFRICMTALRP